MSVALVEDVPKLSQSRPEDRLALEVGRLARQNEALHDFAALVAHELKTPLHAALVAEDKALWVERALALVDALLETARTDPCAGTADAVATLDAALADLDGLEATVEADLPAELPVAPNALQLLLRNLIGNASSAGAHNIHVAATQTRRSWSLVVDDDGVGLSADEGYAHGSGLGLQLARRLTERLGGTLELVPRKAGGARATIEIGACAA